MANTPNPNTTPTLGAMLLADALLDTVASTVHSFRCVPSEAMRQSLSVALGRDMPVHVWNGVVSLLYAAGDIGVESRRRPDGTEETLLVCNCE